MRSRDVLATIFAIAAGLAVFCVTASAQDQTERDFRPSISASGEATVTAKPDRAEIDIGVFTLADTAQAAGSQNASKLDAVLSALRKVLGPSADIKTISYSLSPQYRYPRDGTEPTITGYRAVNTVRVRTDDLEQVGKIIDAATNAGANTIQQLQFELKDPSALRNEALRQAAQQAKSKADAIASALGVRVVRLLSVSEGGGMVIPRVYQSGVARAQSAAAPTPIDSGTIDVHATVSLVVQIGQ
jgi:uncharacterized protein YggE